MVGEKEAPAPEEVLPLTLLATVAGVGADGCADADDDATLASDTAKEQLRLEHAVTVPMAVLYCRASMWVVQTKMMARPTLHQLVKLMLRLMAVGVLFAVLEVAPPNHCDPGIGYPAHDAINPLDHLQINLNL